jgi:hypothetical protein
MPLKNGVNRQFITLETAQQRIRRLIRPIQAQGRCKWDKEVIKKVVSRVVVSYKAVSHLGPGQVVDPGWMGGEELGGPRRKPFGETVIVLLRGSDLPAHHEEHDVQDCYFLGKSGQIWKSC